MKTLIAVAVVVLSALSFGAQASSRATLLEAAAKAYKYDTPDYTSQGYYMGMVSMAVDITDNCVPEGIQLKHVLHKVADEILLDATIQKLNHPADMINVAIHKAYPCVKS
ncbi:hypothetical protein PP764_gp48 [Escherichia phage phi G17]|uniref:Uncharacterized protein n=1 Tax=Escherichia phage phi G17 TaxID=2234086 RepID=A0A2Z4Q1S2_9CAUD|nr:hypothetical protein PP764_gp48 [Escherichia phage phi G17]AWY03414.1 hypothetical protein [Escherichia phage phi G17]